MTHEPQNPHDTADDTVLLPRWMRLTALVSVVALAGLLVIALADGADRTPAEQSPYRNAPEEVLSPGD